MNSPTVKSDSILVAVAFLFVCPDIGHNVLSSP